ncbi:MAG TPA: ATP-binding protein [Tepidisphaeraceae bacterium]|nr:ATP-binding protein [Tepidisphaeraceae bacterium]
MQATLQHIDWEKPHEFPQLCRFLAQLSPQPMVAVEGRAHIVRYANPAFRQLVGKEGRHLLGRPFVEAVHEGMANGCAPLLDRVLETGQPEALAEQEHFHGAQDENGDTPAAYWSYLAWAILSPAGGAEEKPIGVLIQVTDSTELVGFRKAAREINESLLVSGIRQHELVGDAEKLALELRDGELRIISQKEAFEAAMNGASLADSTGILARAAMEQAGDGVRAAFFIANPEGTRLYGIPGGGAMPDSYVQVVNGLEIGPDSPACGSAAYLGRPVITRDVTRDPLWAPLLGLAQEHGFRACWSFPIQTQAGRVVGTFAMYFRDPRDASPREMELAGNLTRAAAIIISRDTEIQERRRAEEALQASEIQERQAREEAQAANHSKDLFLATLSHEMRTPLNAIFGWMSILRSHECTQEDLKEGLDVIERNTKVQVQLIDDVLDVARIVSGKLRLEIAPCDLSEVARGGLDVVRAAAKAKNITLEAHLDPAANGVSCDAMRMQQVVWNLLSNAIKFTPIGGAVRLAVSRERNEIKIQVTDTGQGMPADLVPFVFDRFRQADSSTRRKFGGLGLGLSIVKQLVELHGGNVEARSPGEGRGSTFIVRFPVVGLRDTQQDGEDVPAGETPNDELVKLAAAAALPVVRLDGLRLLVVDDERDVRRLMAKVLGHAGAAVTTAGTAAEAMAALDRKGHEPLPHVLISDISMPNEDGFDLIRQVRQAGYSAADLPAVALTAFVHADDQRQALLAGFQVHMPKPVDLHELTAVIAGLAGRPG